MIRHPFGEASRRPDCMPMRERVASCRVLDGKFIADEREAKVSSDYRVQISFRKEGNGLDEDLKLDARVTVITDLLDLKDDEGIGARHRIKTATVY